MGRRTQTNPIMQHPSKNRRSNPRINSLYFWQIYVSYFARAFSLVLPACEFSRRAWDFEWWLGKVGRCGLNDVWYVQRNSIWYWNESSYWVCNVCSIWQWRNFWDIIKRRVENIKDINIGKAWRNDTCKIMRRSMRSPSPCGYLTVRVCRCNPNSSRSN